MKQDHVQALATLEDVASEARCVLKFRKTKAGVEVSLGFIKELAAKAVSALQSAIDSGKTVKSLLPKRVKAQ